MLFLIAAIVVGIVPAAIAHYKGRSFLLWWAFGAVLIVVAVPMAVMMGSTSTALRRQGRDRELNSDFVECPSCHAHIRAEATACWFCRRTTKPTRSY
jgi:hypothetical protein